jgi:hypothetical protein
MTITTTTTTDPIVCMYNLHMHYHMVKTCCYPHGLLMENLLHWKPSFSFKEGRSVFELGQKKSIQTRRIKKVQDQQVTIISN